MNAKRKVVVTKERNVTTYAEMWHTSYCLLVKGQEELKMSVHQFRASLIFTAFTFEAYLNHIGAKIFSCWEDLERLSPKEKLNVIAERLRSLSENYLLQKANPSKLEPNSRANRFFGKQKQILLKNTPVLTKYSVGCPF